MTTPEHSLGNLLLRQTELRPKSSPLIGRRQWSVIIPPPLTVQVLRQSLPGQPVLFVIADARRVPESVIIGATVNVKQ